MCGNNHERFLGWLHAADFTSHKITLLDVRRKPTIYLIQECDTDEDVTKVKELCEEIFEEQLAGWYKDSSTWPRDRSYDVFCQWFDYQHHSMLIDLCDEPLIHN